MVVRAKPAFTRSTSPAGYCTLILSTTFISFTAAVLQDKVNLKWEVADPRQIHQFDIERKSADGQWQTIGSIPATDIQQEYSFTDQSALRGKQFYRIRMMGKGNSVTLSAIKSVVIKSDAEFIFYPNPATSVLQIIRLSPAPALLKLTDLSGKTLLQQQVQSKQISLVLPVPVSYTHLDVYKRQGRI